mgnify:CR=1 FL=1
MLAASPSAISIGRRALGKLATDGAARAAVPVLCDLARDTHPQVRQYAMLALGKIGDERALPTLRDAANRSGGPDYVLAAALKAIDRMETFRASLARTPFVVRGVPRSTKKARGRKTGGMASRQRVKITVSVGVAVPGKGGRKAPEVLAAADKALYRAKKAGRNRVAA